MDPKDLTESELRERLTDEQYRVTREKATEPAFTGKYHDTKTDGTYMCVVCGEALFESDEKFDSGSGWPSFTCPSDGAPVEEIRDSSHGMARTEVVCGKCKSHLGHVFPDGPGPGGMRYCINSASLNLEDKS
jgi:peptide-methionine (R)-S-oxide reductase